MVFKVSLEVDEQLSHHCGVDPLFVLTAILTSLGIGFDDGVVAAGGHSGHIKDLSYLVSPTAYMSGSFGLATVLVEWSQAGHSHDGVAA